jgi:hypothetical protein
MPPGVNELYVRVCVLVTSSRSINNDAENAEVEKPAQKNSHRIVASLPASHHQHRFQKR